MDAGTVWQPGSRPGGDGRVPMMSQPRPVDRQAILEEYERVREAFHRLLAAQDVDWSGPSHGTRWTNEQLLFHMLFGYLVVRALLVVVWVCARLPAGVGRGFARLLDAGTPLFDRVNYYGSGAAATALNRRRMGTAADRVLSALARRLRRETETNLRRGMYFPVRWDPFFGEFMTLADVYRYPNRHFEFHRRQLAGGTSP